MSLIIDYMTIYLENPKKPTKKKKSHKIDEFSKNSGYKVNTHKKIVFLDLVVIKWKF